MKLFPRALSVCAIVGAVCASLAWAGAQVGLSGEGAKPVSSAYAIDGTVYLPADEVLVQLGFETQWHAVTQKLVAKRKDIALVISPGLRDVVAGSSRRRLEAPPRFVGGVLCVPREFVERALPALTGLSSRVESLEADAEPAIGDLSAPTTVLKRVVIDAGHGGHDTGARSPDGILEKNINLAVALKLRALLSRFTDVEPILTRDADFFIPLGGRTQIANRAAADLFISIHSNGSVNRAATGLETYFLSFEATDRQAARLAAEENASIQFEQNSPFAAFTEGDDLSAMLRDMVSADNMRASERLAAAIQYRMVQMLGLPNRGVKQAPFFVLVGSRIPAVLVEVGFVSNPDEARKLASEETQWVLANALFQAVMYYDEQLAQARSRP